jgi:hypothetical protein
VAAWVDRFYAPAKYLRTELYLALFCAMFVDLARRCGRGTTAAAHLVAVMLWTALPAYYLASLAILAGHEIAMLVWLVALMLTGAIVSSRTRSSAGLGVWIAVALPLLMWCVTSGGHGLRREGLIAAAAIYVIALLAGLEGTLIRDEPRDPDGFDVAWLHLNPLVMFAAAYILISPISLLSAGYLAAVFAAGQMAIGVVVWKRHQAIAIHFAAVGFTLAAIAIALIFRGAAITAGWAVEGALVIVVAIRQRLAWLRIAGALLFAIAVAQTIGLLSAVAPASHIVVLNARDACAALVIALCYALAWLERRQASLPHRGLAVGVALLTAQVLTLIALTSEINAFWAMRDGRLASELMLSVTWGLYATALVVIGLARDYAPIRYLAITVLAITIAKVFVVDTAELERIYRVGSVIALGVLLLFTSYFYSRARKGLTT